MTKRKVQQRDQDDSLVRHRIREGTAVYGRDTQVRIGLITSSALNLRRQMLLLVFPLLFTILAGCGSKAAPDTAAAAGQRLPASARRLLQSSPEPTVLTAGLTAYVRVKGQAKFSFGDAVTLIAEERGKKGFPTDWLVAKGSRQVKLPAYCLTANKAEISFLRGHNRIPAFMLFITLGPDGELHDNGDVLYDQAQMSSGKLVQMFDVVGSCVMFEEAAKKAISRTDFTLPFLYDSKLNRFEISSSCMYYCAASGSDGKQAHFECINLQELTLTETGLPAK